MAGRRVGECNHVKGRMLLQSAIAMSHSKQCQAPILLALQLCNSAPWPASFHYQLSGTPWLWGRGTAGWWPHAARVGCPGCAARDAGLPPRMLACACSRLASKLTSEHAHTSKRTLAVGKRYFRMLATRCPSGLPRLCSTRCGTASEMVPTFLRSPISCRSTCRHQLDFR